LQKEEEEFDLKRKNLKAQHTERETEREKKRDEMRKKYGINKDDTDDALVN
ncbi:pituitary tumor-transforming gene 1 -interacting -like isoform X1, partial [Paramuricea clavata]